MDQKNFTICVVICYIGKLPWYFKYFAHSCAYNPTVDFLIVTDDKGYHIDLPKNVKIEHLTLPEIEKLASKKIKIDVEINTPYKLCDFKPTYGVIFSEWLKEYDFWAHGDLDVIYGDIRSFVTQDLLLHYDLISVRHDFLTGYFLLFRNNFKMNWLFQASKDYIKVFTNNEHFCFDETNHKHGKFTDAYKNGTDQLEIKSEIESMNHVVLQKMRTGDIKAYFDLHVVEGYTGNLIWKDGRLFYKNRYEILLYHLILFKKVCVEEKMRRKPSGFFRISKSRIY